MNKMQRAQKGDAKALAQLMRQHAPLVYALARRFEQAQDAFQEGCIGLLKAIRGFREEKGFAFSTYAVPLILGEMKKTRNHRFGWRTEQKMQIINRYRDRMMQEKGRDAYADEIKEMTGWSKADIALLLEGNKQFLYYDDEQNVSISLPDPAGENWLQRFLIRDILERMPQEYSYVLKRRYIFCESQQSLSARLKIHQSSVCRTEKKARLMFMSAWQET